VFSESVDKTTHDLSRNCGPLPSYNFTRANVSEEPQVVSALKELLQLGTHSLHFLEL